MSLYVDCDTADGWMIATSWRLKVGE